MNVLHVNMSLDPIKGGGTVERTIQISRHLTDFGIDSVILATDAGLENASLRSTVTKGLNAVLLKCLSKRFYLPYPSLSIIEGLVKKADVINLMGHWTVLNAVVYRMAQKHGKPYTVCPAGALPLVGRSRFLKRLYNQIVGYRIIMDASACIAIAPNENAHFEEYGVRKDRITLLPNGINPEDYVDEDPEEFRKRFFIGDDPYIFFVGRLNWIKGPDILLRAFAQSNFNQQGVKLVFAGPDGGLLNDLIRTACTLGVSDRVHFVGHISGSIKSQAYYGASLLAIPSRSEAMSIVALEAGICGTPVLLTDQCGFNEVSDIGGGEVVPVNIIALADALQRMINDSMFLIESGKRLKLHVSERYLWSIAASKYIELFEMICK